MAALLTQEITDLYAIYNGDACEILPGLPSASIGMCLYSPPFCGLYRYSSSERDLSNARTYKEFFEHYEFVVREIHRLLMPGRITAVHAMEVPNDGANYCGYADFPGDVIRLHERLGFDFLPRICIWNEPLEVRNRTLIKSLAHWTIVEDSTLCTVAAADFILPFRKNGKNPVPVKHPVGLLHYAGERQIPAELYKYRGYKGKQTQNRYSHWIWRNYASCFWDDISSRILPYKEARDPDDEQHWHPLQLDVIERCIVLWSNPGETILTPFMGVGSEVYGAVTAGRRGIGVELKPSYYRQAVKNLHAAVAEIGTPAKQQGDLFAGLVDSESNGEPASVPTVETPSPDPEPERPAEPAPPKKRRRKKDDMPARNDPDGDAWLATKNEHPGALVCFSLPDGGGFEFRYADAVQAASLLGLKADRRDGVAVALLCREEMEQSIRTLLCAGHKVAVIEQVADPNALPDFVESATTTTLLERSAAFGDDLTTTTVEVEECPTVRQNPTVAPGDQYPPETLDLELTWALCHAPRAGQVWSGLRATGASDEDLRQAVAAAFGVWSGREATGSGPGCNCCANDVQFWLGYATCARTDPPTLRGNALVERVRKMLGIPQRKEVIK